MRFLYKDSAEHGMGLPQGKSKKLFLGQKRPWFEFFFFMIREIDSHSWKFENFKTTKYSDDLLRVDDKWFVLYFLILLCVVLHKMHDFAAMLSRKRNW